MVDMAGHKKPLAVLRRIAFPARCSIDGQVSFLWLARYQCCMHMS